MRKIITTCMLIFYCTHAFCQAHDTLHVYFPLDKNSLTEAATKSLDSLITNKVLKPGTHIILMGFGDYLGSSDYNKNLSYARARNVQDYLTVSGFDKKDITLCIGKGKITRAGVNDKTGSATDRKVNIIIDHPVDTPAAEKFRYSMLRLDTNEAMPLHNIQFFRGSIRITPESLPELNMLIDFMLQHSTYNIQLEGHICCLIGIPQDEPYDESTLSTKRAECIYDSLITHNVDKTRVKFIGLGNRNPIVFFESTDEDRLLNRRVEVRILSK